MLPHSTTLGAGVYLIHFDTPYKHAKHYLGWASSIQGRLERHTRGDGARLIQVIQQAGITWQLVRTWPDADRSVEKRLKAHHGSVRLCPICQHIAGRRKPIGPGRPINFYQR
jgi:predicted GIY-YIG superfamily endonuclease